MIKKILIKKWKTVKPDQLQKAWKHRYKDIVTKKQEPDEEAMLSAMPTLTPKFQYYGQKVPKNVQDVANVFGEKVTEVRFQTVLPKTEQVERIATKLETKITAKKLKSAQAAYENIARSSKSTFLTKPKIRKFSVSEKKYYGSKVIQQKLSPAVLEARKIKPKEVLTKGIGEAPRTVPIGPMTKYKGVGPAKTGAELKLKYEKVASRAVLHGKGAGEKFVQQVRDKDIPVRSVKDLQKKFLRTKRGAVSEEQAFELGFPGKTGGGSYQPFEGLSDYNPFKSKGTYLTDLQKEKIAARKFTLGTVKSKVKGRPPELKQVYAHEFAKGSTEEAFKLKPRGFVRTYSGRDIPADTFKKQRIKSMEKSRTTKPGFSKKTRLLYPNLSKNEQWFQNVTREYKKKKGPFDW